MLLSNNLDLGFLQIGHSWSCSCNQTSKTITLMHFYFWKKSFFFPQVKIITIHELPAKFAQCSMTFSISSSPNYQAHPDAHRATCFFFIFCSNLLSFSPVISISAFYCLSHVLQGQYNQDGAQCYTRVVKSCTSTVRHAGSTKATQFQYSYWTAPAITCHQIEMFSSEDRDSKMIFLGYITMVPVASSSTSTTPVQTHDKGKKIHSNTTLFKELISLQKWKKTVMLWMTVKASVTERFSQSLHNAHLNMYRSFSDFCHKLKWESFFLLKWKSVN